MDQKSFRSFRAVIFGLLLALSSVCFAGGKPNAPEWRQLPPAQQQILAPLASQWAGMSALQRSRLIAVAEQYPKMTPEARLRFQKRIKTWALLTREQREEARDNYRRLKRLPRKQREAIKQRWQAKQQTRQPVVEPTPVKPDVMPALALPVQPS